MKNFYLILLSILLLNSANLFGQNKKIAIAKKTIDFGTVDKWDNPPATFTIYNKGKQALTFLPTFQNSEVAIEFPQKPILPNSSGKITVRYYTDQKGTFSEKIPIYSNFDDKPLHLQIKGNILSFANQAYLACPGSPIEQQTTTPQIITPRYKHHIVVVDKETMNSIENAQVRLIGETGHEDKLTAKLNGMVIIQTPVGRYTVKASHTGYYTNEVQTFLDEEEQRIIVPLERIETERATASNTSQPPRKSRSTSNTRSPRSPRTTKTYESDLPNKPVDHGELYAQKRAERAQKRKANPPKRSSRSYKSPPKRTITTPEMIREANRRNSEISSTSTPKEIVQPENNSSLLSKAEYQANNIVFLIDVSQSMEENDKLSLMKGAMKRLTNVLRDIDKVTVIVYSTKAEVVLPGISSDNKDQLYNAIESLNAEGSTRGIKGLETAYQWIDSNYISEGNNQIILATDGEFKDKDDELREMSVLVRQKMRRGILLSVVGFGQQSEAVKLMKKLAFWGKGRYINIQHESDAEGALIEEIKKNSRIH